MKLQQNNNIQNTKSTKMIDNKLKTFFILRILREKASASGDFELQLFTVVGQESPTE